MLSNEQVIRHWVQVFNRGKGEALTVLNELNTDDYIMHDPQTPIEGKPALREFVSILFDAFPDLHITLEEVLSAGDRMVYRALLSGTHRGEFMGIKATGRKFSSPLISVARMADGKIAEEWQVSDMMGMMQQIGALPPNIAEAFQKTGELVQTS